MTDHVTEMVGGAALYALQAPAIRKLHSPSQITKGKELMELERQGVDLKAVVAWFAANPVAGFWDGVKAMKPKAVLGDPERSVHQRGEAVAARSREEIDREASEAYERERTEEAIKHRGELLARLRAANIHVENEERIGGR